MVKLGLTPVIVRGWNPNDAELETITLSVDAPDPAIDGGLNAPLVWAGRPVRESDTTAFDPARSVTFTV